MNDAIQIELTPKEVFSLRDSLNDEIGSRDYFRLTITQRSCGIGNTTRLIYKNKNVVINENITDYDSW